MNKKIAVTVGVILFMLGIILILAGPAFRLIPSTPALFAGIVCILIGFTVKIIAKKTAKIDKQEENVNK